MVFQKLIFRRSTGPCAPTQKQNKKNAIAPPVETYFSATYFLASSKKTQTIFLKTMLRVRIFRQRTSQRALKNAPDFSAEFRSARAQNRAQILEPNHEKKALSQSGTGCQHKCWTPRRSTPWHGGGSALCAFRPGLAMERKAHKLFV